MDVTASSEQGDGPVAPRGHRQPTCGHRHDHGAPVSVRGKVAIIGAAETDELGVIPGKSALQLHAEAALNAIRDCGIDKDEIDGFAAAGQSPIAVADYLGLRPGYLDATTVGGTSFLLHVRHASAA